MATLCVLLLLLVVLLSPALGQVLLSPASRACYELGFAPVGGRQESLPVFTAGEVMRVLAEVPGGKNGVFQFYLCPGGTGDEQDCLARVPLELAGGGGRIFDLSLIPKDGQYVIPIMVPENVICPSCTLMWEVVTRECEGGEDSCIELRTTTCVDIAVTAPGMSEEENTSLLYVRAISPRR